LRLDLRENPGAFYLLPDPLPLQSAGVSITRSVLVALMFALLAAPAAFQRWFGGDTSPYVVTTIAIAALAIALVLTWPNVRPDQPFGASSPAPETSRGSRWLVIVVTAVAVALLFVTCRVWLDEILTIPLDPFRGDMLVIVREGVRRALEGRNPYTTYHVPWPVPLPYGPMLWGPYALPMLLRVDPRFLSVIGELFVPVACAAAAIASAARGRLAAAAGALLMLGVIGLNGSLVQFTSVAHTPVYWPFLALFVWLTARERWYPAALLLGLLVVARLTMIAVVPVLLMAVWQIDRPRFAGVCVLVALAVALPFLPFAIRDPHALAYGLYGSYQRVIKATVWPDATVPHTIGITGVLLTNHLNRFVEATQAGLMAVVYAAIWTLLRRGRAPVGLMGTALLAFSMTALWPVTYFYFDVFLMFAAGILIDMPWLDARLSASSLVRGWAAVVTVAAVLVAGFGAVMLRLRVTEPPIVTWRDGPRLATIPLVRRTISPAFVDVRIDGVAVGPQRMNVALNGLSLGAVTLDSGVEHVMLAIPESLWQIGANTLELSPETPLTFHDVIVRPTRSLNPARP
jgi:hypothetical protein